MLVLAHIPTDLHTPEQHHWFVHSWTQMCVQHHPCTNTHTHTHMDPHCFAQFCAHSRVSCTDFPASPRRVTYLEQECRGVARSCLHSLLSAEQLCWRCMGCFAFPWEVGRSFEFEAHTAPEHPDGMRGIRAPLLVTSVACSNWNFPPFGRVHLGGCFVF